MKAKSTTYNVYPLLGILSILILTLSCKKFVEVDPPKDQLTSKTVFTDSSSANQAIVGIYSNIMTGDAYSLVSIDGSLASDELSTVVGTSDGDFFNNSINVSNSKINSMWSFYYKYIFQANAAIEGITNATGISVTAKSRLIGEAKFIRAFWYFYMCNLWGDIPLVLTTDYRVSAVLPRTPKEQVIQQIISDLKEAKNSIAINYISTDRTRPNKWAVTALLARVYLYNQEWQNADAEASQVINSGMYSPLPALGEVFQKNSKETIWQLLVVNPNYNTFEGYYFTQNAGGLPVYIITPNLLSSFDLNDERKNQWLSSNTVSGTQYFFPYKYKIGSNSAGGASEYPVVFRLAEQYLIRAEAKIQQPGKVNEGISDLNILRSRASGQMPNLLVSISSNLSKENALLAVEHERQTELFAEWGHRWFDLKRTDRINNVLEPVKGSNWQSTDILWPIPNARDSQIHF